VDISGEIEGFEALAAMDEDAKRAGVMLLPGGGFDVVPSDCLIAYVAGKLPAQLILSFISKASAAESHAARLVLELRIVTEQGRIRRDGKIVSVPNVWDSKFVDFGRGPSRLVTMGWGDVSTAYHSTGIPECNCVYEFPQSDGQRMMRSPVLLGHCFTHVGQKISSNG
jgi:short subunit dehydrogenase-like uncharacterized protein